MPIKGLHADNEVSFAVAIDVARYRDKVRTVPDDL